MKVKVPVKEIRSNIENAVIGSVAKIDGFQISKKVSAQVKRSAREIAQKVKASLKKQLKDAAKVQLKHEARMKKEAKAKKSTKPKKAEVIESR